MGYDNRPNLSCKQFEQTGTDYLYMAGTNCICSGGTISSDNGYKVSGVTIFDAGFAPSSIQIGCNSIASGIASTVVGAAAKATGTTSIAIGCSAYAYGEASISLGTLSVSKGICSIAIGCSTAICTLAVAIGNACSCGINALAIGEGVLANGSCSSVIGSYITNVSGCSLGLGWYTGAIGNQAPSIFFSNIKSYIYGCGDPRFGFGTCNPQARVHIRTTTTSGFRLDDGSQGLGKVLGSDEYGNGTWCMLGGVNNVCNGLTLFNNVVCLGGNLTGETIIYSTIAPNAVSFCCGGRINSQCGYQISGTTMFRTAPNTLSSIYIGQNSGNNCLLCNNIGIGSAVLFLNVGGVNNVAVGNESMSGNSYGCNNAAVGYRALFSNGNGCNNAANGAYTLYNNSGSYNTANGAYALYMNNKGSNNTANGAFSLYNNDYGVNNTANGAYALYSNLCGIENVAVGGCSMYNNLTGQYDIGIGSFALYNNISGEYNVAIGSQAMYCNVSGKTNVAIGYRALYLNRGCGNVALGLCAGYNNISGCNRLYIANSASCCLIYGEFDNKIVRIDGNVCSTQCMFAVDFIASSDERNKMNIRPIELSPVNVEYKQFNMRSDSDQLRYGVIAQDLEKVNPELVRTDSNGMLWVSYIDLLVKEIAYLKYKISELEEKIS